MCLVRGKKFSVREIREKLGKIFSMNWMVTLKILTKYLENLENDANGIHILALPKIPNKS